MHTLVTERRAISMLIVVLSFGLLASTFGLSFADLGSAFSPMFFPRIILAILAVLAALNLLVEMRVNVDGKPVEIKPVLLIGAAFLIYVQLLLPLGYFISSVLMGMVVLMALGLRNAVMIVLMPVLSAATLVVLFNHVLKMPLPSSPFFWWL